MKGEFDLDGEARVMLGELEAEAQRYPQSLPVPWLLAKFTRLSLDTYTHNFTLHHPLGKNMVSKPKYDKSLEVDKYL